jgi:hypothetical protein
MTEQLSNIDVGLMNLKDSIDNKVTEASQAADVQSMELQDDIVQKRTELEMSLTQAANTMITNLEEQIDILLMDLMAEREAKEGLAQATAQELRKRIIYAVHVLRYARDFDEQHGIYQQQTALTGVDELDRITLDPANIPGEGIEDHYHYSDPYY